MPAITQIPILWPFVVAIFLLYLPFNYSNFYQAQQIALNLSGVEFFRSHRGDLLNNRRNISIFSGNYLGKEQSGIRQDAGQYFRQRKLRDGDYHSTKLKKPLL